MHSTDGYAEMHREIIFESRMCYFTVELIMFIAFAEDR